ncbi:DUF1697 domain-containing protein [Winogradskyella alexanderae]|uniref:DUF1697 domain-containing protein n=1 Tax=Winogradskyella alexanderae TaxID=2877123 RepID=A0ABS7XRA9_9FLAO|nr:DUF1697 domain-containing protein [Winogradskyella alexanderae]MCA0132559.1 DUF1697 domain-containing protein [Winogradskyella alexanderae]
MLEFRSLLQKENTAVLEKEIKNIILDYFDFDIPVMVRTNQLLKGIFDFCLFDDIEIPKSYFAILSQIADKQLVNEAFQRTYENKDYHITDYCIYFYCGTGYGD